MRDAQLSDIAHAVGINRALIYRHFSTKEELFAVTLVGYLEELEAALSSSVNRDDTAVDQLRSIAAAFLDFGQAHPAFVDCAQSLLRRRGNELLDEVNESIMLQLGLGMGACLGRLVAVLEKGNQTGEFAAADPGMMANVFYAQALGVLNLTHMSLAVHEGDPGLLALAIVPFEPVKQYVVDGAVMMAQGNGASITMAPD